MFILALVSMVSALAVPPVCTDFEGAEVEALGVEIEIKDSGLGGLDLELKLDGEEWEIPGVLSRSLDWTTIELWGTPSCFEDSDCWFRVSGALAKLPELSVQKGSMFGPDWTLIECTE